jgi:hypothetical protein
LHECNGRRYGSCVGGDCRHSDERIIVQWHDVLHGTGGNGGRGRILYAHSWWHDDHVEWDELRSDKRECGERDLWCWWHKLHSKQLRSNVGKHRDPVHERYRRGRESEVDRHGRHSVQRAVIWDCFLHATCNNLYWWQQHRYSGRVHNHVDGHTFWSYERKRS